NQNYNWFDQASLSSDAYYRIQSVDQDGSIQYSSIVKIKALTVSPQFALMPNPTTADAIYISFIQAAAGKYQLNLLTETGQRVLSQTISHNALEVRHQLKANRLLATGQYRLEIVNEKGTKLASLALIIQ
ncbi:MAG TPA: hypothetical protein PKK69_11730, partial [Ferruginibacter sp.]|nr:hypothetical protein [Ferruginibacter sp.]